MTGDDEVATRRRRSAEAGSRAGRGFRYQDAVGAAMVALAFAGGEGWSFRPEGDEDLTVHPRPGEAIHLQIRSRRFQQQPVSGADLANWIREVWERYRDQMWDPWVRIGVVVDREVEGLSAHGFEGALTDPEGTLAQRLEPLNRPDGVTIEALLSRTLLFVVPDPAEEARNLLAAALDCPLIAGEVIYRALLARIGALADERAGAGDTPPTLAATEVPAIVTAAHAAVDLAGLEAPLRDGWCEHADFSTEVPDDGFYRGVDVVPGHIAAGLVIDRPEDVADTIERLSRTRTALVTGPSGVGKTAVALLAAHHTRESVRWLRVRQLGPAHELLRYADVLGASAYSPVGFIIDDVGRIGAGLWDDLVRSARHRPGVLVLGTTREEDLDLLDEAPTSILSRPKLSEELAEALWQRLRTDGSTAAAGWREAFEDCDGLTLEYVHVLTTGQRLPDLISAQVDRRRREHRDDEFDLLRVAAFCASYGASTDLDRYSRVRSASVGDVRRVLARLLDEHLLRHIGGNRVAGLHRLRSLALVDATHRIPPPSRSETAGEALLVVPPGELAEFASAIGDSDVLPAEATLESLRRRFIDEPTAPVLVAILDGLRMAGARVYAAEARRVFDEHDVPLAMRHVTASLALIRSSLPDGFDDRVRSALPELRALPVPDLRPMWLRLVDPAVLSEVARSATTVEEALALAESLAGIATPPPGVLLPPLTDLVSESTDLEALSRLVGTARLVDEGWAAQLVDAAGGEETLASKFRSRSWVTLLTLKDEPKPASEGAIEKVVRFEYLVADEAQADVHGAVVDLCRLALGLFPSAEVAAGTAVDGTGKPFEYRGFVVADKRIHRKDLPVPAEIRWNRVGLNAFADAGTEGRTDRLAAEALLLTRAMEAAEEAGELWVRGQALTDRLIRELDEIATNAQQIWKRERLVPDADKRGSQVDVGDVAHACRLLCGNALPRLLKAPDLSLASFMNESLREAFSKSVGVGYWRLLAEDHDEDVRRILELIDGLRVTFLVRRDGQTMSSQMRRAARSRTPIRSAASVAHREARVTFERTINRCRSQLERLVGPVQAVELAPTERCIDVPPADLVYLCDVSNMFDWLIVAEGALAILSQSHESTRRVAIVPCRDGHVLPACAVRTLTSDDGQPFPAIDDAKRAAETSGAPTFEAEPLTTLMSVLNLAAIDYALDRLAASRALTEEEVEQHDRVQEVGAVAYSDLKAVFESDSTGVLEGAFGIFGHLLDDRDVGTVMPAIVRGEADELMGAIGLFQATAIELKFEPELVQDRLTEFLDRDWGD